MDYETYAEREYDKYHERIEREVDQQLAEQAEIIYGDDN